jgi:predicted amidohydrolase
MNLSLGVVQFRPERGQKEQNLLALGALVDRALDDGLKLLVMPEMAATGYRFPDPDAVRPLAEPALGPTFERFSPRARAHRAHLIIGLPERSSTGRLYNSALVIGPDGELVACYRKRLLYEDDETWATPGNTPYPSFATPWGRATVGICMDMNDERFTHALRETQPDLVCFPTNWIDQGSDIYAYWTERLWGVDGALLAADRYGSEDGVGFWGRSAVLQRGQVLAHAPAEGDGVFSVSLPVK